MKRRVTEHCSTSGVLPFPFSLIHKWLRFRKHGLTLDCPISWVPLPNLEEDTLFPIIKVSDMVQSLGMIGCFSKLFGDIPEAEIQDVLREFWRRYSLDTPDHQVFSASLTGTVCLQRCIPYFIHGDEGRSHKRKGVMLLSVQGALGKGTSSFVRRFVQSKFERDRRMGVNISGHSFGSRLLFAGMLKRYYEDPAPCLLLCFVVWTGLPRLTTKLCCVI